MASRNHDEAANIVDLPQGPLAVDLLGQSSYIAALSDFIRNSETPMTIAVQGEWGCGKTSLMNAIAGEVCQNYQRLCQVGAVLPSMQIPPEEGASPQPKKIRNCLGVWINTWQYSILKNDSEAQVSVIRGVARELSSQMDALMGASSAVKEAGRKLLSSISGIALTAAKVGISAAGLSPESLNGLDEMMRTQENGPDYFRSKLRDSVRMYLDEYNAKHRGAQIDNIIFFIDDLDRLDPPVAVQVLSLLKNLFEVPNCIFMLAIDYEVVVQGLASRFGARTETNEREFRSFFDKIIQLTFRVPLEGYQVETFIQNLLDRIKYLKGVSVRKHDEILSAATEFTLASCGKNPRSIKRMFNTLSLTREIHRQHPTQLEAENPSLFLQLLFGVVCLQSAYPRLYDELVRHPNLYDWLDSSGGSDADEQGKLNVESFDDEDISPMDFDLNAFAQTDPWIRKRQTSAQKLVYSIFKLVMQDKYKKKSTYTDSADLHTTKDYLEQIIQTSRLTATEDEGAESFVCDTLDEFVAHCAENGTDEATLQEVRTFCRVLNKVFDDALTLEFTDDRVLFRATAPHSKLSKVISTAQVLTPLGILIRAGRSHKLGVVPAGKLRSMKVNRRVEHVQEFEERDINPIKARFKEITGVQRVSSRWVTVLQEEMHSDSDQPTSEAEETISENNVGTR